MGAKLMQSWFEIKVRGILGPDDKDCKEMVILGRVVKWKSWGIEWSADPKHREIVIDHFSFKEGGKGAANNGDKEEKDEPATKLRSKKEIRLNCLGVWLPD